jgi:hypothetical protein
LAIQRKQISPWPWLIGIIILAAFIWIILTYIYEPNKPGNPGKGGDSSSSRMGPNFSNDTTNDIKEFVLFSNNNLSMGNSKYYIENGLIKLQSALSFLADRVDSVDNSIIDQNIDSLDIAVAEIDTASLDYFSELKPAFLSALKVMDSIRKVKYPDLNSNILTLRDIEHNIKLNSAVNIQLIKIRRFYLEAGNILQKMDSNFAYSFP